jgi:heavy metal sensor kinase
MARRALAPVDRMTATAADITARKLNQRLEVMNPDDELGRLASTLNDMIERLARSFEEIRRFTADAAHELRTPLALLRTEIEVALRGVATSPPDARFLEGLLEEIERLTRLVTQLLFLCREDAGLIAWEPHPVQLDEVVSEVADHIRVVAGERGQTLNSAHLVPCRVWGNEDRLRQVIFNLLDNAIKYTPAGGTIDISLESHNGQTRMVVSDTGIGIAAEHLAQIFDRFYRVDPSRSDQVEGTGLGLAICRSIAESHGGQLRVESTLCRGTQVTFLVPSLRSAPARSSTFAAGFSECQFK